MLSLGVCFACLGFLPYNLRLNRPAAVFMGDSGSQVLGFALASLGLAASWTVAGSTVATLLLPILVLAVPILDTTLVTVVRLFEGRPVTEGGRDHTSHRLVYQGLSDKRAVVLLCVVSAALGLTSLAYKVLDDTLVTLAGVLITFAFLLQFGSYLADVDRAPPDDGAPSFVALAARPPAAARRGARRLRADLRVVRRRVRDPRPGRGHVWERTSFHRALPACSSPATSSFIAFGLYRSVWRYAGARDAVNIFAAVVVSAGAAFLFICGDAAQRVPARRLLHRHAALHDADRRRLGSGSAASRTRSRRSSGAATSDAISSSVPGGAGGACCASCARRRASA